MDLDTALTDKPAEGATATDILRADHAQALRLISDFQRSAADEHAARVAARTLCLTLELHDAIESEVFYPAVREADPGLVARSLEAHAALRAAIEKVKGEADASRPLDASMEALRALLEPHVAEEENRLFPAIEKNPGIALRDLGVALIRRKEELTRSTESFEAPAT